jgi:hypothetical protein
VKPPVLSVAEALPSELGLRPDGNLAGCRTSPGGASRVRDVGAVRRADLTEVSAAWHGGLRTIDNATESGLRP